MTIIDVILNNKINTLNKNLNTIAKKLNLSIT